MSMICSSTSFFQYTVLTVLVSGHPAEEPVATKNGDIYEKRLITKHIEAHGVDPITNEALTVDDLVVLRVSNSNGVKPRQVTQSSIPGLLQVSHLAVCVSNSEDLSKRMGCLVVGDLFVEEAA